MKRHMKSLLLLGKKFLCVLSLSNCGPNPAVFQDKTLVAFGDSITVGTGAKNPTKDGYVSVLARKLGISKVTNLGVGSTKIADSAQITTILATPVGPDDVVVFLTGMNDVFWYGKDPVKLQDYRDKIIQIMDYWESQKTNAFIGLPLRINQNGLEYGEITGRAVTANSAFQYRRAVLESFALKPYEHVHMIETHYGYEPTSQNNLDGIHPNELGMKIIADVFYNEIKRIMR